MNALDRAKALAPTIIEWRHYLHQHPELGYELPETKAFVRARLEEMGYEVTEICPGGLVAVLEGGKPGKTIMLRADMDALPMDEVNDLPFKSQHPGIAHTCGHDTHTAMLLGAAKLLMEDREQVCGKVKFMFQPNEEGPGGARVMLNAGLLENPHVDVAMGFHCNVGQALNFMEVGYSAGPMMASTDVFRIDVTGRGCHGANPERGVDPINIMVNIHSALAAIKTREVAQKEACVLTIGQISAGGAGNIIPNEGFMSGTIRAFSQEVREQIKRRMVEICEGVAKALGGEAKVTFLAGTAATINDPDVCHELLGYMKDIVPEERLIDQPPVMGSEDFSEVLMDVPGSFFRIGMGGKAEGYDYGVHSPHVRFNEDALHLGTALFVHCAEEWLKHNA